ncbi:AT-hook motif nuclear-localized protein 6 isoform X1 [Syzygium oleosum]|uniref:AT-hook motif nuclear-localized protein 6 isoform X1 n=1 Tax=Syzygium oleosum TaxID=219896 RepID=UPI0011D299B7|nr:AT-hook motif nuclear-localized protein 6 isoform X1 [Syzygium oleosum]XP_056160200.1 AT-hook motif nuclear-localized protein 6 isoform X1 [Syzygium oleosum]
MEEKEETSSEFEGEEGAESFRVEPRTENAKQIDGPAMVVTLPAATALPTSAAVPGMKVSKKRGRPRKAGRGGVALSPMPISASIPLNGEFSAWERGKGASVDTVMKKHKVKHESPGKGFAYFVDANFTPHVLIVNPGEDVMMKVMSFSRQGSRAICVLSACGTISNVSLCQPTSCGGTLTYEGCFEILSLSGSFAPIMNGGTISRSGGMSVSLSGPDGRVIGGGLAGLLLAAGPVQVIVGSFLQGHQMEQKPKRHKLEPVSNGAVTVSHASRDEQPLGAYGGVKTIVTSWSSFNGENINPVNNLMSFAVDNKLSFSQ